LILGEGAEVVEDAVERRNQEKGGDGGGGEAEGQARGEGNQHLRLQTRFGQERQQAGDGGGRGQQDRPEAVPRRLSGGLGSSGSAAPRLANEHHQKDRVV